MKPGENIEQLFKNTFEHFESPVNPQIWTHVQNGINAGSGVVAPSAAKLTIGKIIASAVIGGLMIAGSVWYFSSNDLTSPIPNTQNQTEVSSKNTLKNSENKIPATSFATEIQKGISQVPVSGLNTTTKVQQPTIISEIPTNPSFKNTSSSEKSSGSAISPQAVQDKHVKSSDASNLIQGNQIQNTQDLKSKDNSSSNPSEKQAPVAEIFATIESGDAPLTVNFSNQGFSNITTWDFGDGSSSGSNSPSHTFEKPGTYIVKLIAKNSEGSTSDQITIDVKSISGVTNIPNVFSPNGDGKNDLFFFALKNILSIDVTIYSQNGGGEIHKWNTLEGNWNGKLRNGDNAPKGVYLYSIQAVGIDGITYSKKGFVTLSR